MASAPTRRAVEAATLATAASVVRRRRHAPEFACPDRPLTTNPPYPVRSLTPARERATYPGTSLPLRGLERVGVVREPGGDPHHPAASTSSPGSRHVTVPSPPRGQPDPLALTRPTASRNESHPAVQQPRTFSRAAARGLNAAPVRRPRPHGARAPTRDPCRRTAVAASTRRQDPCDGFPPQRSRWTTSPRGRRGAGRKCCFVR